MSGFQSVEDMPRATSDGQMDLPGPRFVSKAMIKASTSLISSCGKALDHAQVSANISAKEC